MFEKRRGCKQVLDYQLELSSQVRSGIHEDVFTTSNFTCLCEKLPLKELFNTAIKLDYLENYL